MQKRTSWKPTMLFVSDLGGFDAFKALLSLCFNLMPKPASLYFWCGIAFANFSLNQLKSAYAEPRPYWVSDEIVAANCSASFGNPSGHMLNSSFFWVSLYLHLFHDIGPQSQRWASQFWRKNFIRHIMAVVGCAFLGLLATSRVYLGAHTLNEVLFGTIVGSTWAAIGHFKVKPFFLGLPGRLHSNEEEGKYAVDRWTYLKALFGSLVVPMCVATLTLCIRHGEDEFYASGAFLTRLKHSGCRTDDMDPALTFHNMHFERSAIMALATGALFGQLFEH